MSSQSFFEDKAIMPDDGMVSGALGGAATMWDELRSHVVETYPNVTNEWKHYGKAAGWTYKFLSKKRNLLFAVPMNGCFRVRIVLGEKGNDCVNTDSELSVEIKEAFRIATPYVEGRGIDINIQHHEQLEEVKRLLKIKFEN